MPVAKSYQGLEIVQPEYKKNGKSYVVVKTKSGGIKQVRWYTDAEYAKMYPKEADEHIVSQKHILGFGEEGYITIFHGVNQENEEWFENEPHCRYARWWGWYMPSCYAVPQDYPDEVKEIRLDWQLVGGEVERLKTEAEVKEVVRKLKLAVLLQKTGGSKRQGKIGDRLDLVVKITGKQTEENVKYNSKTHLYEFKDSKGNFYKWKTQAKDWSVGTEHHVRGTVKGYDEVDGEEATVLTRCMEV